MSDDVVKIGEAGSEQEAAIICGFLESNGIKATYDKGGVDQPIGSPLLPGAIYGPMTAFEGRQEILVRANDAERATKLLAER